MSRIEKIKGTRDFYPAEMAVRRWLEERWRETSLRYGFEEYDAPVLEPLGLYTQKSGAEIVDQLYAFEDKGGRKLALRPEMTPSLARMISARGASLPRPIKWFSIPRLFRYERPQRGRFREFWQLNLDIVGVGGIEADAEIMAAGVDVLRACGLGDDDFAMRYSDRRLLEAAFDGLGLAAGDRGAVYGALDRFLKGGADAVDEALDRAGVERKARARLVDLVSATDLDGLMAATDGALDEAHPAVGRLQTLAVYLDRYGVGEVSRFDPAIVRGLAYYTGIVFEMYDRVGELRAICGGGRYDGLMAAVGGASTPAVGFGLGEAVLLELLAARDCLPEIGERCLAWVVPVDAADRERAIEVVTRVRSAGLSADLALFEQALGKVLRRAANAGARAAIIVGEHERSSGQMRVKDLATGDERSMTMDAVVTWLERRASGS